MTLVCLTDRSADLRPGGTYTAIPDAAGARLGLVRVVDDSGEDYLYPAAWFRPADDATPSGNSGSDTPG